jgi:predicted aconitase
MASKVLAIPSSRGSCSGSGVILELLLNEVGPAAIIVERFDDILTLGVIVAEEVFERSIPILCLGSEDFAALARMSSVLVNGPRVQALDTVSLSAADMPSEVISEVGFDLSDGDRAFLAGDHGKAAQVAMKITLRMAMLQGASRLIDVTQAHIDGCIYAGRGNLEFASRLRDMGARVVVPTTLNAISVDHRRWRTQGLDPAFGIPAQQLADAYVDMGCRSTFTCAPYLLDSAPTKGEQIVWAESNAVVYANSVLGARTMKYPDYLDICIALTGRAPLAGCHVDLNRQATLVVTLPELGVFDDSFYPLLGYHIGIIAENEIPVISGLEAASPSQDDLKAFGAAFATTSSAPMFHIAGVTPEAPTIEAATGSPATRVVAVEKSDLQRCWHELDSAAESDVQLVSLGNPHFSSEEIITLAALCKGRKRDARVAVIVTCGRGEWSKAQATGAVDDLERFGVQFVMDTCWCMITEPLIPLPTRTIMTNSGKYAHYGPGLSGRAFHFGSLKACVDAACTGHAGPDLPGWLA